MKFPRPKVENRSDADVLLDEASALALSRDQLNRLRYAKRLDGGTKSQRRHSSDLVAAIRREIMAGVDETMRLEKDRAGGEVKDFNTVGAKHLSSRDGLFSLYKAGKLEPRLVAAGLGYRRAREAEHAVGIRAVTDATARTFADHVGLGLKRAKLGIASAAVDREVALELKHRPDALDTLRRVAGDGQCIGSLVTGSRGFDHRLDGLCQALEIAARHVALDPT